jgi:hypothetical protein
MKYLRRTGRLTIHYIQQNQTPWQADKRLTTTMGLTIVAVHPSAGGPVRPAGRNRQAVGPGSGSLQDG